MSSTAGPWKVIAEAWLHNGAPTICTAAGGGMILATVTHREGNYEGQLGDPLADARLMAAAPELLEAAHMAYGVLCSLSYLEAVQKSKNYAELNEAIGLLAVALNKTTGE